MQSDHGDVKKSVRMYFMIGLGLWVFTVITVAVNQIHIQVISAAVAIALVIAVTKGSMVAAVFMHLSHERRWIYGTLLLTLAFFIVLIAVPLFTMLDTIGTPVNRPAAQAGHAGH